MNTNWSNLLFSDADAPPMAIVVAHPDDEVIGAGAQLPRWPHAHVIYVTDGAPRDSADAQNAGFAQWQDYAGARKREAVTALSLAGIAEEQIHWLNCPDQEASFGLSSLIQKLTKTFSKIEPRIIITQPYEGGHPDHDATAFAVHVSARTWSNKSNLSPIIVEATSYHNSSGTMSTGTFLPFNACEVKTQVLSREERNFKRRLFDCFETQQKVLQYFPIVTERFRLAPHYDFEVPPHPGKLYYELFDWKMTRQKWTMLARQALSDCEHRLQAPDASFAGRAENQICAVP